MQDGSPRNRVLVVDDDPAVRETFMRLLIDAGFEAVAVTGGEAALAALRDDPSIAVMLLDLDMPALSGRAVRKAQLADAQLSAIPTVIVSGAADARINRDDLRADDYLSKPFRRQELLAVVGRYCQPDGHGGV